MSEEKKLTDIKFFICSTVKDLSDYREAVINRIKKEEGKINAQEFFGARDDKPLDTCLSEVEKADVFIMFVAFRRGSVEESSGKSFVELEYEEAKRLGLKKLVYFLGEDHPWPHKYVDDGEESLKLKNFKDNLKKELTIDNFTTKDDLSSKVTRDLFSNLTEWGFQIDTKGGNATLKFESVTALDLFQKLPRIYYGQEHEIDVEFGSFYKANENECKAFGMTYEATIKRIFKAANKDLENKLDGCMKRVFASYEAAEELIKFLPGQQISIRVKTIVGENNEEKPLYKLIYPKTNFVTNPFVSTSVCSSLFPEHEAPREVVVGYKTEKEYFYGLRYLGRK